MKIRPMGEELFYAGETDRQTDSVGFRKFANAPISSQLMPNRETAAVCFDIHTNT
jgi:hypothetical protein